jgi:FixJ family two-component response regulator
MGTAIISHERTTLSQTHAIRSGFRPTLLVAAPPIVFVIHEDACVREWLGALMRSEGWRPETYQSAQEFLARPRAVVPNCLVLDVSLAGTNSLDLQARLAMQRPDMAIIFVSDHADVPTTVKAMKAGAVEFFTKPLQECLLLSSVREALDRSRVVLAHNAELGALRDRFALLTNRERQVMTLVVAGLLNKQIGGELGISEITVKAHRGQAMQKMKASSLPDLVKMAASLGLSSLSACGMTSQRQNSNGPAVPSFGSAQ